MVPGSAPDLAAAITARIDRLPENRHVWSLVIVVALAGLFEVYDLYQTAYVPAGLVRAGIFSSGAGLFGVADQAAFAGSTFLGLFIGAIAFASVADRFGRRRLIAIGVAGFSIANFASAFAPSLTALSLIRLIAVCFEALVGGVATALIVEEAPPAEFFSAPREERTRQFLSKIL